MNTNQLLIFRALKSSIIFRLHLYLYNAIGHFFVFFLLFTWSRGAAMDISLGDTVQCLIELELEQLENGDYQVSLISDTTWTFPSNVTSTAQITLKAPTGSFTTGTLTNLVNGVVFLETGRVNHPMEAPDFDYISFGLGTQGTSNITYQKGLKVPLFSISNAANCTGGSVTLMDNFTDPFAPPNIIDANVGQQITVSGFGAADVPIAIKGEGVSCNSSSVLGVRIVKQDINCHGQLDAMIIAKGNGGMPSYSYLWSTGDTLSTIVNLASGTYSVTVKDANGDSIVATTTIFEPDTLVLQIEKQDAMPIGANNGTAAPIVSGGSPPYQYAWSNGSNDSLQTDLEPGNYTLTITDANACTATASVIIEETNCPTIDVMLDINAPHCVGDSTGSLGVIPLAGTAPFTFLWGTGDTTAILTNISSASYMVTVTDARGCTMAVSALLPDAMAISIELTTMNGAEAGQGTINATVEGGMLPYTYEWSNGSTAQSISNLESGVYDLTVTDDNGCTQSASAVIAAQACDLGVLDDLGVMVTLDSINCTIEGEFCLPVPLDSLSEYALFINGMLYSGVTSGCDFDTLYAYTYFTLPGRGASGPYVLTEWTVNGVQFSGTFQDIEGLVDSMNTWDPVGNWNLQGNIVIIQGGLPSNNYGKLIIRHPLTNSLTTLDINTNLTPKGTLIQFEAGNHELVLVRNTTACSDTLIIEQPCGEDFPIDTLIIVNLREGEREMLCLEEIFGNNVEVSTNQCPELSGENANITLAVNTLCIEIEALSEGRDEACYAIVDKGENINLTLQVNVEALPVDCEPFIDLDTIFLQSTDCQELMICTPLIYDSLLNYSITDNGLVYTGLVEACDSGNGSVLSFAEPGIRQLILRDEDNCLDTLITVIACDEDNVIEDVIEVGDTGNTCIMLNGIPGTFQTVQDLCPEKNGEMAMINIDGTTGCLSYTGVELGVDTACIEICDHFGYCDTVLVVITVSDGDLPPLDFEAVDDSTTTGIDNPIVINVLGNDVFNNLDTFLLINQPANGIASFNVDGTVSYAPTMDYCDNDNPERFLYAICEGGICDTAEVVVTVLCANPDFEAVDDSTTTTIDNPVVINALGNDIFDNLDDFLLINQPDNGIAVFNADGTISYSPITGYCNDSIPERFLYEICERGLCDTAEVVITVQCTSDRPFVIYTGLSPNGDGLNDVFQIDGIEDFPNNKLQIFNRWGNRVYIMDGYKNEWNGTYNESEMLPDGTYFYLLDDGEGQHYSGWLQIRR